MEVTLHATTVSRTLKLLKRRSELQKLIIFTFPVRIVYERLCFSLCTWGIWQRMPFNSVGCQSVRLPPSGAMFLISLSVVVLQVSSGRPLFHWPSGVHPRATLGRADGDIQSTHYQSSSIFFIGHKIQRILYNHFVLEPRWICYICAFNANLERFGYSWESWKK